MIVVEQEITREAPQPSGPSGKPARKPAAPWSSAAQLERSLPLLRLLAEIWSVPEVGKVGVHADESGLQVRVLMTHDQRDARARIYDAERDYLNATRPHGFSLRVTPIARSGAEMIAPFETVLER